MKIMSIPHSVKSRSKGVPTYGQIAEGEKGSGLPRAGCGRLVLEEARWRPARAASSH